MIQKLDDLINQFDNSLEQAGGVAEVLNIKAAFLGKKGKLSTILKGLKNTDPKERRVIGTKSNQLKEEIIGKIDVKLSSIEIEEINKKLNESWQDITLRESKIDSGLNNAGFHPISIIQRELEDVFLSMGYEILDGPHIEDEYHNFEALNLPRNHPARDLQDTFWFNDMEHLLRTQTSPIQIRGMETHTPPFKFVGAGKTFRCEKIDASHEFVFHQLEGMMVAENISVANLVYFLRTLLAEIFGRQVDVRLRHGFFPFVEPGFELDFKCLICNGKGCSVCKNTGWMEFLGCGMVHPNVLRTGNIDPDKYNGFAFGLGIDRLVMMRYGIDDVRHFHSGNLKFISQFKAF